MKLLICTQVVDTNDPVLGFFCGWVEAFAKHCERIEVICLREGAHALPTNVRVYSLGKEDARPESQPQNGMIYHTILRLRYAWRFWRLIWKLRKDCDAVFVHMNPEYVVLGGLFWRAAGKKVGLWYAHKSVTATLRCAVPFAQVLFTSSNEGLRLSSPQRVVVGQGIGSAFFKTHGRDRNTLRIMTASRISPSKRIKEMLDVMEALYARGRSFTFTVVGAPAEPARDEPYLSELKASLRDKPYRSAIAWRGATPHAAMPATLAQSDIFLNLSTTGSMDKAVLEALASGLVTLSSNEAFRDLLEPYGLFLKDVGPDAVAQAILGACARDILPLSREVAERHSLGALVPAILAKMS